MRAFEEFKAANDARLDAIENGRGDVLLEEKVDRIDRALTEQKSLIETSGARRPPPGARRRSGAVSEHKSAWSAYLRRGDDLGADAVRSQGALASAPAPDGGYVAPPELDRLIEQRLKQVSPMRADRDGAHHERQRVQEADQPDRGRHGLGRGDRRARRRRLRRRWRCSNSRRPNSTPTSPRRRRCSTTASSISKSGSRAKWRRRSPAQERAAFVTGDGDEQAARASSATTWSPKAATCGARSATSLTGADGALRRVRSGR